MAAALPSSRGCGGLPGRVAWAAPALPVGALVGAGQLGGGAGRPPSLRFPQRTPPKRKPLPGQRHGAAPSAAAVVLPVRCKTQPGAGDQAALDPSSPGDNTTLPCGNQSAGIAGGGIRVLTLTYSVRATCQPGDETPRHFASQAKEPFAIQRTTGPETWGAPSGGSSRLPVGRSAGPRRSGDTASEAQEGRSGWKPRALPLSGGSSQSIYRDVAHPAVGFMARLAMACPSAARASSRPVTAKASSKTGIRPRLKRPATLQIPRHAAGPSFWPALDLSAALPLASALPRMACAGRGARSGMVPDAAACGRGWMAGRFHAAPVVSTTPPA